MNRYSQVSDCSYLPCMVISEHWSQQVLSHLTLLGGYYAEETDYKLPVHSALSGNIALTTVQHCTNHSATLHWAYTHCKYKIVNMTYSLSFWLQMSEPITHIDTDNYTTIHHRGTTLIPLHIWCVLFTRLKKWCMRLLLMYSVIICVQVCNWFTHLQPEWQIHVAIYKQ